MNESMKFNLGVDDGTNAALYDVGIIDTSEHQDRYMRSRAILYSPIPELYSYTNYWDGYNQAYANTRRPEVLSIFTKDQA